MKKNMSTPEAIDQHFIDAAEILVKRMKNPSDFLQFITEALEWCHDFEYNKRDYLGTSSPHDDLTSFIEYVIQPWLAGGKNMISNIAEGLETIYDSGWSQDYISHLGGLTLTYNIYDSSDEEAKVKIAAGISALFEIGYHFSKFEHHQLWELRKEKEAA